MDNVIFFFKSMRGGLLEAVFLVLTLFDSRLLSMMRVLFDDGEFQIVLSVFRPHDFRCS